MRLVSWNIHGGVGTDGRRDLSRIAALLEDMRCDAAALQEVGDPHRESRVSEVADDASWLGRRLGWFVAYGPNLMLAGRPYGNAVLSRFPISHAQNYDLSVPRREPRGCLRADLALPDGRSLHLFDLHLGLSGGERRRQAAMLLSADLLRDTALTAPLVVCGDFNMWSPLPGPILRLLRTALRDVGAGGGRAPVDLAVGPAAPAPRPGVRRRRRRSAGEWGNQRSADPRRQRPLAALGRASAEAGRGPSRGKGRCLAWLHRGADPEVFPAPGRRTPTWQSNRRAKTVRASQGS